MPGRRARDDRAARRRQVRQGQLQGLRRTARRRRLRRQRALRAAQGVGEARRQGALHGLRARRHHDEAQGARQGRREGDAARRSGSSPTTDLHRARLRLRHARRAPARAVVPEQGRDDHAHRRARGPGEEGDLPREGRPQGDGAVPQRDAEAAAPRGHLHRDRARRHRHRARVAVQRRLQRERLLVREQHQHARRRHAPHRLQGRAHAHDQRTTRRRATSSRRPTSRCPATTCAKA